MKIDDGLYTGNFRHITSFYETAFIHRNTTESTRFLMLFGGFGGALSFGTLSAGCQIVGILKC